MEQIMYFHDKIFIVIIQKSDLAAKRNQFKCRPAYMKKDERVDYHRDFSTKFKHSKGNIMIVKLKWNQPKV